MFVDLKPYDSIDSGAQWLGRIPAHWRVAAARSVFAEVGPPGHVDEPLLSVTIGRGVLAQSDLLANSAKRDSSNLDRSKYKLVEPGDIAYNKMRAWQGAIGLSRYRGIVSPAYVVVRPRRDSGVYFHHLLRTPGFAKEAERWSYGITSDQWSLRPEHFKMIVLPVPPADEQAAIVKYLAHAHHRIDRAITAKRKLIALLEEQKQAIINQAVTRGLDPTAPLKDSGDPWLGEIPESWDRVRLKSLISPITQGWSPQCDAQPPASGEWGVLKTGCSNYGVFRPEQSKRLAEGLEPRPEHQVRQGDIVMSRASTTALVGSAALVEETPERLMLSDKTYRFRTVDPRVLSEFLVATLQTRSVRAQIESRASGASFSMQNISQDVVRGLVISLPPVADQGAILGQVALALSPMARTTFTAAREIDLLREFRTRLTSDVVTGQIDIRHIAATLPDLGPEKLPPDVSGLDDDLVNEAAECLEDVDA